LTAPMTKAHSSTASQVCRSVIPSHTTSQAQVDECMDDTMLTDFQGSIAVKDYERAAQLLEEQAAGPEAEALWMCLCNHALDDVNLDIAERCWERLNNAARAEFLRKTMGPRCPLGPQGAPSSSGDSSESSPRSVGSCLADNDRQEHDELLPATRHLELRADDRDHVGLEVGRSVTGSKPVSTHPPENTSASGSKGEEYLFLMDPEQEVDEDEAVDLLKSHGLSDRRIRQVLHLLSHTSRCSSTHN